MERLDLKPGKKVGEILEKLFNMVVEKEIENDRETLLSELKKL
jgi:tRNA nucleotidyltransferase/poly(A) polymerase